MFKAARVRLSSAIAIVFMTAMTVTAPGAWAGGGDAEALVNQGVELRKAGKDREALALFQRAAQMDRTPRVVGQMGLAEVALGIWPAASEHLHEALTHAKDPWIGKNRAVLEKTLATVETHLGSLEIWGTPPGAEIIVDGKSVGVLPLAKPVPMVAGMVTVTLQAKGYQPVSRTLQISGQQLTRENVDLAPSPQPRIDLTARPAGPSPDQPSRPEDRPPAGAALVAQGAPPAAAAPDEGRPLIKRWWFWAAIGVVLVGGAVAAVSLLGGKDESPACPGIPCSSK